MKKCGLALIVGVIFCSLAGAREIYVPADFSTIQAGIDDANNGDVVIVSPGRYYENINFKGKNITVASTAPEDWSVVEATILDGSRPVDPNRGSVVTFAGGETKDAVVKGFTITGGSGYWLKKAVWFGGGICCYGGAATISNNIIENNNVAGTGGGIRCQSGCLIYNNIIRNNHSFSGAIYSESSTIMGNIIYGHSYNGYSGSIHIRNGAAKVLNNIIYNNASTIYDGSGSGIFLHQANNTKVSGNTILNNSNVVPGSNLEIRWSDNVLVENNIIANGINSYGIHIYECKSLTFRYNNVWNNEAGNYDGLSNQTGLNGNISVDPLFIDSATQNYHLQPLSPCRNTGNPVFVPEVNETDIDGESRVLQDRVDIGSDEFSYGTRPIADAGPDQLMMSIPRNVTLDGSSSWDPQDDNLSYNWKQLDGPEVILNDPCSVNPNFVPAEFGVYVFELIVNDGTSDSFHDTIGVVIGNKAPVANAGPDRYAATQVVLNGRDSYDPEGFGEFIYQWRQISGPTTVQITGAQSAEPLVSGFVQTSSIQQYEFELVVSDGQLESMPDCVKVYIVPSYGINYIVSKNGDFNPDRPTIFAFDGGDCYSGSGMSYASDYKNINWIITDIPGATYDYSKPYGKYADMLIVYLSEVAPNYNQPIQTIGHSTGNMPALDVANRLNSIYADPRYAVNRVTLLDTACTYDYILNINTFLNNPVAGEQCWVDNYYSTMGIYRPGVLNIRFPSPPADHTTPWYWWRSSISATYWQGGDIYNGGISAGGYWSVAGAGKNLQLAANASPYYFEFVEGGFQDDIKFYNQSLYLGRLPEPVTLIDPMFNPIKAGSKIGIKELALTCQESENAVGYRLKVGADPYRVMDYNIISDTATPPDFIASDLPAYAKYWTVEAYDQYGSTIYADPMPLEYLACTGYEVVSQKRLSRTVFEYGMKMKVKNMCDYDVNNITIKLSSGPAGIDILNDKVRFGNILAGGEGLSIDTFIVRIDRSKEYNENDYVWQITDEPEGDLNADGTVNMADFVEFCRNWLVEEQDNKCDLYRDGVINYIDYAILAEQI